MLRTRHFAPLVFAREVVDRFVELRTVREHAALPRRRGRELGAAGPGREVRVGLLRADTLHRPFHANLPPERIPVEQQRRTRIRLQLAPFAAAVPGEEDESVLAG